MPYPISVDSVVQELAGSGVAHYLMKFGDASCVRGMIQKAIDEAASEVEIDLNIRLFQTRIVSRPAQPDLVRGTDYDEVEDAYDYVKGDFDGFGTFRTKLRPIVSVQRIQIRYGDDTNPIQVVTYPEQWIMENTRMGIINIVPLLGMTPAQTASIMLLPVTASAMANRQLMPLIVALDYTAGYLPRDYDPEDEDAPSVRAASPDHDARSLLAAVRYIATAKILGKMNRAIAPGGGSAQMGSFSQSYAPARFMNEQLDYERRAKEIVELYKRTQSPPNVFVM